MPTAGARAVVVRQEPLHTSLETFLERCELEVRYPPHQFPVRGSLLVLSIRFGRVHLGEKKGGEEVDVQRCNTLAWTPRAAARPARPHLVWTMEVQSLHYGICDLLDGHLVLLSC